MSGVKSVETIASTKHDASKESQFLPVKALNSSENGDILTRVPSSSQILNPPSPETATATHPDRKRLSLEDELAILERETSDDLVYNALGSFQVSPDTPSLSYIPAPESNGSRGKYTVRSAKVSHSGTYIGSNGGPSRVAEPDVTGETLTEVLAEEGKPLRDSGISSASTDNPVSPSTTIPGHKVNAFQWNNTMNNLIDPSANLALEMDTNDHIKPTVQVNGSIGAQPGPSHRGDTTRAATTSQQRRHNQHPKPKLRTEMSVYGATDPSILRSELLAAVEFNKSDKVRNILNTGIDPNSVCDEKGRWPLHIACLLGLPTIAKLLLEHGAQKDQPDTSLERTPLHYAAATSKEVVHVLLSHRADIHAKNKFGATALHYAAGAGQADCCRILASAGCDVNGRDGQKMTPLLMAARVDDTWSIDVLLEYGGDIHAADTFGKTALHHAAETCEGIDSDYGKMGTTFRKLAAAGISINAIDQDGKTALYYATQTGSEDAVMILYELGAELMDGMSLLTMAKKFPHIIPPFLDKCVSSNIEHYIPNDKLASVQHRDETESILREMGVLNGLTLCKDTSILSHPVCESLLRLKWKKVKWYLYLDMLLFAVFLAFLTAVIFMEYESDNTPIDESDNSTLEFGIDEAMMGKESPMASHSGHERYCMDSARNIVVWSILWVLTAGIGIREMIQLIQAPLHYVVQIDNILELVLVSSVVFLSLAECGVKSFVGARDHFAAVCLIVGWTIQVTLYGKIPVFGVYIRMFAAVSQNILKCMFTYLGLLFAFSLTLHFLFRTQKDFDSVGFTFLKTFAMMIGEVELARTFIDSRLKNAIIVPFTSHLVVALFIIFISIILSSLFIALAVCDISSMQREGEYMQLVQQVKVSSQLEDALQKRSLLYPQFGMRETRSLHQRKGVIFPNLKDHGKLSKDAIQIVLTQHARRMDPGRRGMTQPNLSDHTSTTGKISSDVSQDDLLQKLKEGMERYSEEAEKRLAQVSKDFKVQMGSTSMAREVLLIKSQLEDMNTCLRELSVIVKTVADRTFQESPSLHAKKKGNRARRLYSTSTQESFSPEEPVPPITSPEFENSRGVTPGSNEAKSPILTDEPVHSKT